jgi:hypothetical protein
MVEQQKKNKLLMIEGMFAIMILIFAAAFLLDKYFPTPQVSVSTGTPTVVGFVPIEIKSQAIDLYAKEPTKFVVFSEKDQEFAMTSLRLSGEVTGEGRAEIVLDNGLGQELMIYSNIKSKQGNMITGMSVSDSEGQPLPEDVKVDSVPMDQAWFKITPSTDALSELPSTDLGNDKMTIAGKFQNDCKDTCYMNMKLKKGLFYTLKIRVDPGTEVRVNELKYTLEV